MYGLCSSSLLSNTSFAIRKKETCKGIRASAGTQHIHYKNIGKERNWSHSIPPGFGIYAWSFGSGAVYCYLESEGCFNSMESCGRGLSHAYMLLWYLPCSLNVQEISTFSLQVPCQGAPTALHSVNDCRKGIFIPVSIAHSLHFCRVSVSFKALNQPGTAEKKEFQLNKLIAILLYNLLIDMLGDFLVCSAKIMMIFLLNCCNE